MVKENIRKVALAIIFVLILIVIALFIGRFTYSYLAPQVDEELKGEGEVTPTGDTIIFSKGNDLSISASTDNFYTGSGNLTDTTNPQVRLISSSDTNNASSTYYAGFIINENTFTYSTSNKTAELILTIRDENGNIVQSSSDTLSYVTVNGVSGFDITGKTGAFNVVINHPISTTSSTTGTTHTWTYTLTFVNLSTDQSINENATLDMDVILQKDRIEMPTIEDVCSDDANSNLLTCHILSQYNGIQGNNGIYYHNENLENGAGDNSYRYSGTNPNNYVCFGSNEATCPSDNLYRIIGVFDGQVKLIKADYTTNDLLGTNGRDYYGTYPYSASYYKGDMDLSRLASYRWNYDTSESAYGSNNWTTSEFNNLNLNGTYLNNLGEWSDLIEETTWYIGGMSSINYTAKEFYDGERNNNGYQYNSITYKAKIGLMYPSDYGFAASPSAWITDLCYYNNSAITSVNWMYMGLYEWTITPNSSSGIFVFFLDYNGNLYNDHARSSYSSRPVFYLNSNVTYVSGDGTQSNPIRIN